MRFRMKQLLGRILTPLKQGIVINSYGRSGSTILYDSILSSSVSSYSELYKKYLKKVMRYDAWDLNLQGKRAGFIYKTHDYPPEYTPASIKYIYIFSDPVDAVFSLLRLFEQNGEDWMRLHFQHLRAEYVEDFFCIVQRDILGLEKHFDAWVSQKHLPVAFVRYDQLWQHEKDITDFIGIPFRLPAYRKRTARLNVSSEIVDQLYCTYSNLRTKTFNCRDFFVLNQPDGTVSLNGSG